MKRYSTLLLLIVAGCGTSVSVTKDGNSQTTTPGEKLDSDAGPPVSDAGEQPADGGNRVDAGEPQTDAGNPSKPDAGMSQSVSVLTLNLWHDFPSSSNLEKRTEMVADFIKRARPEFVATQEAGQGALLKNRCKVLAEKTGYSYKWVSEGGVSFVFAEGPCVLSLWPITSSKTIDLPHPQQSGLVVRKAIAVTSKSPWGPMTMLSTHFSNGEELSADRADQAFELNKFAENFAGSLPVLVGGDFNAPPTEETSKFLRGEVAYRGVTTALRDAWFTVNPQDDGFTSPAGSPTQRIDYIYVHPGTKGARARACERVFTQPIDGIYASDHYGVFCQIDFDVP